MRIGLVSFWFTRGQAFVSREIRGIWREAGHETFVLARPDKLQGRVRTDGIWDEEGVTVAGGWEIPPQELRAWARENRLDVCHVFQNELFDAVRAVRDDGVVTIGAYMWEKFSPEMAAPATAALDVIYSMTTAQTSHYAGLGILAPRVRWSVWPELHGREIPRRGADEPVTFYYPAGYLEARRAIEPTVKAFLKAKARNARLLVKSTKPVKDKLQVRHPQVVYHSQDVEREAYLEMLRGCDVCLSNTRWEGLGLVLYEAIAMGMPIICPDFPPMNENVRDGLTGIAVKCSTRKKSPSGTPAADVGVHDLAAAIRRLSDRREVERMSANTLLLRDMDYGWERTRQDYLQLLDFAVSHRRSRK